MEQNFLIWAEETIVLTMTKTFFLLTSLLITGVINNKGCKSTDSSFSWTSGKKLTWTNFKGKVDTLSAKSAVSTIQLKVNYSFDIAISKLEVNCLFHVLESWVRDTSTYLLCHEQGHFDIGEVAARRLRKALIEIRSRSKLLTPQKIDSIFFSYEPILKKMQEIYDEETNHSKNIDMQLVWNARIKKELDSLEKYKYPRLN